MSTNVFFNQYEHTGEQQMYEDLLIEHIQIGGQDMYYIPYTYINKDQVYGEDDLKEFNNWYLLEMFIKTNEGEGFQGDSNFISKFGLEIRDQITFTISRRRFVDEIGRHEDIPRPREGDLIYFPLNNKCFEIKFVNDKPFFYPFGALFTYDLVCELFEYSSEKFNTGIPEIDRIQILSQDQYYWSIQDSDGNAILDSNERPIMPSTYIAVDIDPLDDSDALQEAGDEIIDWSIVDPFSENGRF